MSSFGDFLNSNPSTKRTTFGDFLGNNKSSSGLGSQSIFSDFLSGKSVPIRGKQDLNSSVGLNAIAQDRGGIIAQTANNIMNPTQSLLGKIKDTGKKALTKTLDILQRPNYAIATAVKNEIDSDPTTDFVGGLKSGITGHTKFTFTDVLGEAGWKPTTRTGKVARGATGFALDVLLDPTTYVTFGAGAGAKVGEVTLAKGATKLAAKEFGREFTKEALVNLAEKSPELYSKFIDQGGVKFFGKTLISGGRISGVVRAVPGMTKLDELTTPIRNTLYALFNRDASVTYGKLPQEFIDLKQKYLDLGSSRSSRIIQKITDIAAANKLTQQEADIITNAIEHKLPLADDRLDNARKLFEDALEKNLSEELKRGIKTGDLPNYVPHILVENKVNRAIPFAPTGVRVNLGATKGRTIGKIASEIPEELKPLAESARNFKSVNEFIAAKVPETGKTAEELSDLYNKATTYTIGKGKNLERASINEINRYFGKDFFDPSIVRSAATRGVASVRATTAADFLKDVAEKFGTIAETAPTGYVKTGAKELDNLVFHPAIAEQIDTFKKAITGDEAVGNLLKAFDKAQNLWKASVTSIFPAFHGRNAISNVFLNYLDIGRQALNPATHLTAAELLNMESRALKLERASVGVGAKARESKNILKELLDKKIFNDGTKQWTFKDLRKEIKDSNIAFGNQYTGFLDIRETANDVLKKAGNAKSGIKTAIKSISPITQEFLPFKAGRKVGQKIEEQARLVNFLSNLRNTGDVATAAARTKQFLFDYQNLSRFEKNFMRRIIPFYTFTRKNLELQVRQILKQPGKFATQAKLFSQISKLLSGSVLSEEEKKNLPDWLQSGLQIVTKRDGNKVELVNNLGTPIESMFANLQPNTILGSLSPAIALPLQIAIGKSFFFDKNLEDLNNAIAFKNAPQFIKDYIGYTERKNKDGSTRSIALNPTRMFIIQNIPPSSRVISTIGQLEDENVSGKLKLIRQLTGLKPYGKDLDEEAKYREKEKMRKLQDLLDKAGVAPIFKRSFIPKK